MPISENNPFIDIHTYSVDVLAMTPAGHSIFAPVMARGRIIEAGFVPHSNTISGMTLTVAVNLGGVSSIASNFSQIISSTLGTFSSTNLFEGSIASVKPASQAYVNQGDVIRWTFSGGPTSAHPGATAYAIIRKG